jgi:hypothetical protein
MGYQLSKQELKVKVYIVNYRGTIYGVFDSKDKALTYAKSCWSESAVKSMDVVISEYDVL